MCECPSQLPRTQPVHITAKRHKLGSQGMREVQIAFCLAFLMRHTVDHLLHEHYAWDWSRQWQLPLPGFVLRCLSFATKSCVVLVSRVPNKSTTHEFHSFIQHFYTVCRTISITCSAFYSNTSTCHKSQACHITHKRLYIKLITYYLIESDHAHTVHTFTVLTTEWPYTPRQTALYYHMMFIRKALPQRILASLPLLQPGSAELCYYVLWLITSNT